jgi:tetratricopeptide (TPR) repeat protein
MFQGLFGGRSRRHYARGMACFDEGDLEEAIDHFTAVLESDADGPDAALARFYRAEARAELGARALNAGSDADALAHFDHALEENGSFPDLHLQRAIALLRLDDPLAAEHAARTALELNPSFVDAGVAYVAAVRAQGDLRRSTDLAEQWGRIAAAAGHPLAAELCSDVELLEPLVALRDRRRRRRALVQHAENCLRDGFWTEAANSLEPLVAETPEYPDLRLRLAAARLGLGEIETAETHLAVALDINPEFADAHVLAGIVGLQREQVGRARSHFDAAADCARVPVIAVYGQALCALRLGQLHEALRTMNRLAGEEEPPEEARVLHAMLEALAGRTDTALERLEAVVATVHRTDYLLDVAAWSIETRDSVLGRSALDRIDDADRTRVESVRVQAAHCRMRGALDRARELCESALMDHPGDEALLTDLARTCIEAGDPDAGLRCLDALGSSSNQTSVVSLLRVRALRTAGRWDEARSALAATGPEESEAIALESLYLHRAADEGDQARAIREHWRTEGVLGLAWRVQDPDRWLGPLRPWPSVSEAMYAGS